MGAIVLGVFFLCTEIAAFCSLQGTVFVQGKMALWRPALRWHELWRAHAQQGAVTNLSPLSTRRLTRRCQARSDPASAPVYKLARRALRFSSRRWWPRWFAIPRVRT